MRKPPTRTHFLSGTTLLNVISILYAKFIYLCRDPGEVLKSTCKLFDKFLALYLFQEIDAGELKETIRCVK